MDLTRRPRSPRRAWGPLGVAVLALLALVSWFAAMPPAARDTTTPAGVFSAERALAALPTDDRPRAPGSAAHADTRAALASALTGLGLDVSVTDQLYTSGSTVFRIHNLLATRAGTTALPGLLVTSHYDSVPAGPGAGDAGAGVAAVLEVARALGAGPPLRRPILYALTDAEELGLVGARTLVPDLDRRYVAVVNLEARGTRGPARIFEVGPGVSRLLRAVPQVLSSSVAAEIYRRMPNDTDYTVFHAAGLTGFNLAFIGGWPDYHSPLDSRTRLDPGSVQHLGDSLLALVRALDTAALPGDPPTAADPAAPPDSPAFTDLFGRVLLVLPTRTQAALAWAAVVGAGLATLRSRGRALLGALTTLAALTLAAAAGSLPSLLLPPLVEPWHAHAAWIYAASLGLALGAWGAVERAVGRHVRSSHRAGGVALLLSLGGVALLEPAPGAAHLLVLPALVAAATALAGGPPAGSVVTAAVIGLFWFPLAFALPDVIGVLAPAAVTLPAVLAFAPLGARLATTRRAVARVVIAILVSIGLVGSIGTARLPASDPDHARTVNLSATAAGVVRSDHTPVAGPPPPLPVGRITCTGVPVARMHLTFGPGPLSVVLSGAPGASVHVGPHTLTLPDGAVRLEGVDAEGISVDGLAGGGTPLHVEATRYATLEVPGARTADELPRHRGDRATWRGSLACPDAATDTDGSPPVETGP